MGGFIQKFHHRVVGLCVTKSVWLDSIVAGTINTQLDYKAGLI